MTTTSPSSHVTSTSPLTGAVTVKSVPRTPITAESDLTFTLWFASSFDTFRATCPPMTPMVLSCFPSTSATSTENCVSELILIVMWGSASDVMASSARPSDPVFTVSKLCRSCPMATLSMSAPSRTMLTVPSRYEMLPTASCAEMPATPAAKKRGRKAAPYSHDQRMAKITQFVPSSTK